MNFNTRFKARWKFTILILLVVFIYWYSKSWDSKLYLKKVEHGESIVVNKLTNKISWINEELFDAALQFTPTATTKDPKLRLKYIEFLTFDQNKTIYKQQCERLFKKLLHPKPEFFFEKPPSNIPEELKFAFEDFGEIPIRSSSYYNDMNLYAQKQDIKNLPVITNTKLNDIQVNVLNNKIGDSLIHEYFEKFNNYVKNKNFMVIGTLDPWIEALALYHGASQITTLGSSILSIYENSNIQWLQMNNFLNQLLQDTIGDYEKFDSSASFSFVEHQGLGRFGDSLSPYGDLEIMQQIHCLLKPGGVFFLGLPCSSDNSSFIEFNAHRIYGTNRLNLLFHDWEFVEQKRSKIANDHIVFVLKKK